MIYIDRSLIGEIRRHAELSYPRECCGALVGSHENGSKVVAEVIPLDNRRDYSKSDWVLWCAAMAETETEFAALVEPIVRYLNETPDRVPISDWHDTVSGTRVGFKARSVVGGFFMPLLT